MNASCTSCVARRMAIAATTSMTPMTISQMPTTNARVPIESNGDANTTTPAIKLMTPTKTFHPRPGQRRIADRRHRGRDAAEDEADADPDGQQQHCVVEMAEGHDRQDQRRRTADEQQNPPAGGHVEAEGEEDLLNSGQQQAHTEEDGRDGDRDSGPRDDGHAEGDRPADPTRRPISTGAATELGGAGVVMREVSHRAPRASPDSPRCRFAQRRSTTGVKFHLLQRVHPASVR